MSDQSLNLYSCFQCSNYYCDPKNTCYGAAQCFMSYQVDSSGSESYFKGCIEAEEQAMLICSSSFHNSNEGLAVVCCKGNLCNDGDYPALQNSDYSLSVGELVGYCILSSILLVIFLVFILYALFTRNQHCHNCWNRYFSRIIYKVPFSMPNSRYCKNGKKASGIHIVGDGSTERMLNESFSSGSGSGLPLIVQRTLARNVALQNIIGQGRFGEVWKGIWQGESVAVKIFFTRDEGSWERETEVYSTVLLRHENILGFYGSDKTCQGSAVQLWLVTHYHPLGSLHYYLKLHLLDHSQLYSLCLSFINGLLHLHTEIMGTQGKPAIAHRDINSNNILVKSDGTCCISDLGLAVIRTPISGDINVGNNDRTGTIRYMCPELLDGSMDFELFENFIKADIYSAALVIWEMCLRCICQGVAEPYSRPFGQILHDEPSFEQMHDVVCIRKLRPSSPTRWSSDKILLGIEKVLAESWHHNSQIRLTALRFKKNLTKCFGSSADKVPID